MTATTLEEAMTRNQAALDAMLKGDCSGYVSLLTDRDDVTWGNPFGPFVGGRKNVEGALANAAARMPGGRASDFDLVGKYLSDDLAVVVQVEHAEAKTEGTDRLSPAALRVTSVYRREDDAWKLVHRHADPITTPR
jgi:uncharacterized protein (TIGR02246 family)